MIIKAINMIDLKKILNKEVNTSMWDIEYVDAVLIAMQEACNQAIDACAESAVLDWEVIDYNEKTYWVDKQSILTVKQQIKAMNEIQNPYQPSNSHELITDCNTDKMKTAEEYLNTHRDWSYYYDYETTKMMDEYSQQQACEFLKWYRNEPFENTMGKSEEELYQQLLNNR